MAKQGKEVEITLTIQASFIGGSLDEVTECIQEAVDKLREQGTVTAEAIVKADTVLVY